MEILDRRICGIIIFLLWTMLVIVKRLTTGSLLGDRPNGTAWIWVIHVFNFSFLLVANPLAAVLLMFPRKPVLKDPNVLTALCVVGLLVSGAGYVLLAWALTTLRGNYQVGGNPPRNSDQLVLRGPYRLVRHPMYSAAVAISLGLACLTLDVAYFLIFCVYVLLVVLLIPIEERRLEQAYGDRYAAYQKRVKRLIPLLY